MIASDNPQWPRNRKQNVEWKLSWTGGRGNRDLFNGYNVSVLQDEKFLELVAQPSI